MVWSNWRTALVLMTAWVGLAWSQAPTNPGTAAGSERILTVHENGKAVRCRVLRQWRQPDGSTAYELQALETGEILTIVEAQGGQGSSVAGRMRARIFRWGLGARTPPAGCPLPPSNAPVPDPSQEMVAGGRTERTVWWEEKNGERVSPFIVTDGHNPFEGKDVVQIPTQEPVVVKVRPMPKPSTRVVQGLPCPEPGVCPPAPVVCRPENGPCPPQPTAAIPPPSRLMATPAPQPRTIETSPGLLGNLAQFRQGLKERLAGSDRNIESRQVTGTTFPEPRPVVAGGNLPEPKSVEKKTAAPTEVPRRQAWPSSPLLPPVLTQGRQSSTPMEKKAEPRKTAWELPERTPWKVEGSKTPSTLASREQKEVARPGPVRKAEPTTFGEKMWRFLNPNAPLPPVAQVRPGRVDTLPPPTVAGTKNPERSPLGIAKKVSEEKPVAKAKETTRTPFSTAALPTPPKTYVPPRPEPKGLAIPEPKTSSGPKAEVDPPQGTPAGKDPGKKDWRISWGKTTDPKVQQPGQPTLAQAGVKPGQNLGGVRTADGKGPDDLRLTEQALLNPERFDPGTVKPRGVDLKNAEGSGQAGSVYIPQDERPADASVPTAPGSPLMNQGGRLPLGAQSVLAAKSGRPGQITYVPVPVATVPEPYRAPVPPAPKMPEAPKPNQFANAFTTSPMPGRPAPVQPVGYLPVPQGMNPQQYQAWQAQMRAIMQAQAMQRGFHPGMVPAGMPQGYGPQMGLVPAGGMQMPVQPGLNYPRTYQGPQAPNPTAYVNQPVQPNAVQQVGYQAMPAYPIQAPVPGPMDRPAPAANASQGADVAQLVVVLRESPYPAQREWAAGTLATYDWRVHPQILPALMQAAKQDPAANVRIGGVFALGRTNAATEAVVSTLRSLQGDSDPRVRDEVAKALSRLQGR